MKIYETHHGQIPESSVKKTDKSGNTGDSFQRVMEQINQQEQGVGATPVKGPASVLPPDGVQILTGAERVDGSFSSETRAQLLREIGDTLDMIDSYAAGLKNSSISPSDMSPLVEHLEGRLESLKTMQADPDLPEGLRSIVSDLAITLGTEVAKFGRGDYE
jgi:hypothetical protein